MRTDRQKLIERAHLIDSDLLARLFLSVFDLDISRKRFGLQQAEIGMVALAVPIARQATTARDTIGAGLFTEQTGGKNLANSNFARPFCPTSNKE